MAAETRGTAYPMNRCGKRNRQGIPCKNWSIQGGSVCRMHGGAAPQVKRAAEERIRELVDPALNRLAKLINDETSSVALSAVKDVLDRAGYAPKQRIDIELRVRLMARQLGLDEEEAVAAAQEILETARAATR